MHGLAFQHLTLCERRAWFHLHRIDYAHLDERMARGTALHDVHRPRDHSVDGLMGLSPDRIDWNNRVVYEAKGGAGAVSAVSRQTAFYALLLWAVDGKPWSAVTNMLDAKRTRRVEIESSLIKSMLADAKRLAKLRRREKPPQADRKKICPSCSYRFLVRLLLMETLYIAKDAKLTRQDATLIVRQDGHPKRRFPVNSLRHIVIAGEAGLTTSLLGLLGRSKVRVTVLDWYGNVSGTFEPFGAPSAGAVRTAQSHHALDCEKRLHLAKEIILGAIYNIRANLRYRAYRGVTGLETALLRIETLEQSARDAASIEALMGAEGNVRASYYEAWAFVDEGLRFGPRRRRPPNNPDQLPDFLVQRSSLYSRAAGARKNASRRLRILSPRRHGVAPFSGPRSLGTLQARDRGHANIRTCS